MRFRASGIICLTCCCISMMFAHGSGSYVFTIYDNFSGNIPLLVIALAQCVGVAYFYGLNRCISGFDKWFGAIRMQNAANVRGQGNEGLQSILEMSHIMSNFIKCRRLMTHKFVKVFVLYPLVYNFKRSC